MKNRQKNFDLNNFKKIFKIISRYQKLSSTFIYYFQEFIDFSELSKNKFLTDKIITDWFCTEYNFSYNDIDTDYFDS